MDTEVEEKGKVLKTRVQSALSSGTVKVDVDYAISLVSRANQDKDNVLIASR